MARSPLSVSPVEVIRQIDKRIDGIRLELFRRGGRFNTLDVSSWQLAWDRHPDLNSRHDMLYRLRGLAQLERDAEIERAYRVEQRRLRATLRRAA